MYLTGDPTTALLPKDTPPEAIAQFRQKHGFDKPFVIQYLRFLARTISGDLGTSLYYHQPALNLVVTRLGYTLCLIGAALALAFLLSIPFAILGTLWHRSFLDVLFNAFILTGQAIPSFIVANSLVLIFASTLKLLPATWHANWEGFILPVIALSIYPIALLTKLLRASLLEVLQLDYIRTAKAKGAPKYLIFLKHALRNAITPMLAALSVELGALIMGAVIVEKIFAYPGMGQLIVKALDSRDVPLMQAFVLVIGLFIILMNTLFDVLYRWLDPRIKQNL